MDEEQQQSPKPDGDRQISRGSPRKILAAICVVALALVLFAGVGVMEGWWPTGLPLTPELLTPSWAARIILNAPRCNQWDLLFRYGRRVGSISTLAEARRRAESLPADLQTDFYNGVAHGDAWIKEDLQNSLQEIQLEVPARYRANLYQGLVRAYAVSQKGRAEPVLEFCEKLSKAVGGFFPEDGIRIGLQQALGDDLPRAFEAAREYPSEYWPALFEELGWRAGVALHQDFATIVSLSEQVPPSAYCDFLSGVIRSYSPTDENQPWRIDGDLISRLDQRCLDRISESIAESLKMIYGEKPDDLDRLVNSLANPELRRRVLEHLAEVRDTRGGGLGP